MVHYYLALALVLAPCLVLTALSGVFHHPGSEGHLLLGFFTALLCVATNTLLILFMIVSGRVLKEAMRSRQLAPEFLTELNAFFAARRAYPLALGAAFAATAAAVLGYGRYIGVGPALHVVVGAAALLLNGIALMQGVRTLRSNQRLLDRAAAELDRLDAAGTPPRPEGSEPGWAYGPRGRWLIFAVSAWGPYLYWALVVWRGDFGNVPAALPLVTVALSVLGFLRAWRSGADPHAG
jgi:hypothetical protein